MTDLDALSPIHTPNRVRQSRGNLMVRCGCCYRHTDFTVAFNLQSIPENEAPETTPIVNSTHQSPPQTPASAPTQNTSPPVQPSEGPVALSAEQVLLSELKKKNEMDSFKSHISSSTGVVTRG